jgi:hypothetical protein
MLFFGITEYFDMSICLFAWIYGGTPNESHFRKFRLLQFITFILNRCAIASTLSQIFNGRVGNYEVLSIEEALSSDQIAAFMQEERFDYGLYNYAVDIFLHRYSLTGC